ncbi:MAG: acylphosphatase [Gammaproteobacteria bacterium]|nr:acylphosphatase [Gammaproteobacteria bacterium]
MTQTIRVPCIRCLVSGRVQGVYYRATTRREAEALGLTGWVSNLPDGRVELVAMGAEHALRQLQDWLWQGPPNAQVTGVRCEHAEHEPLPRFEVR